MGNGIASVGTLHHRLPSTRRQELQVVDLDLMPDGMRSQRSTSSTKFETASAAEVWEALVSGYPLSCCTVLLYL